MKLTFFLWITTVAKAFLNDNIFKQTIHYIYMFCFYSSGQCPLCKFCYNFIKMSAGKSILGFQKLKTGGDRRYQERYYDRRTFPASDPFFRIYIYT